MNHNRLRIDTKISNGQASSSIPSPRRYRGRSPLPGPRTQSFGATQATRPTLNATPKSPVTPSAQASSSRIPSRASRSTSRPRAKSKSPVESVFDESVQVGADYVLAMHDYSPDQQNATCLAFKAGQVIRVHNKHPSGWWDGELEDRRGWFPSNYVQAEIESLTAEELPGGQKKKGHVQSQSVASTTSWTSTTSLPADSRTRPRSKTPDAYSNESDSYCPALMVPLLHGLSLLQNAVRSNRATHFAPSTACIISCVRAILSATETLQRDAPILQRYPSLGYERRQILSVLAALVAQAKKAADPRLGDNQREAEVESMLRLGGQVFAHVRRFLTVAVQCGVELPNQGHSSASMDSIATEGSSRSWSQRKEVAPAPSNNVDGSSATGQTPTQSRPRGRELIVGTTKGPRARSLTDVKRRKAASGFSENETMHLQPRFVQSHGIPRKGGSSISSSSASISSISSDGHPSAPPPFPSGVCTGAQVMEALRSTHDQYLSTIAAFIGHAHSHSRTSHASSTGHLYDLVREIVEMVCKLLTIVEAVMNHPDVPSQRVGNLKAAKEGLYNVTSSLAESVRLLTIPLPAQLSEEEEKQSLLRSATNALKAGADCVAAVKVCLNRSTGDHPFYIELPNASDNGEEPFSPNKYSNLQLMKSWSLDALKERPNIQDINNSPHIDLVPVRKIQDDSSGSGSDRSIMSKTSIQTDSTAPTSTEDGKILRPAPLNLNGHQHSPISPDLGSPRSFDQGDEDVTWEADGTNEHAMEESILSGEPPATAAVNDIQDIHMWTSSHDYALEDAAFGSDGKLVGATMEAIVEKLTPHNNVMDPDFVAVFFMTFRLFSSPHELVRVVIERFNVSPPAGCSREDYELWQQRKGIPVRLRVSNFIKTWVENYWRPPTDDAVAEYLAAFVRDGLASTFPAPAKRILEFLTFRRQAQEQNFSPKGERLRDPGLTKAPPSAIVLSSEAPRPTMSRTLLGALRKRDHASITITDFDALELARQLTIMECSLYCAITPEEMMETGNKHARPQLNVRAVSSLSTAITGWVAESILNESDLKKRTSLVRFFVKVADRCLSLNNFSTCRAMLAALDSSTISRLSQTWAGIPHKSKTQLDALRRIADYSRNFHEYRTRLKNTPAPAVPFLGLFLTDVIFCKEGNPSHRSSPLNSSKKLINWSKYNKLAGIVHDVQRFQLPYNLKAIPEVQDYLTEAFEKAQHHGDLQDLYRRSLLIEPKQPADAPPAVAAPPTSDVRQLFNWATRSQTTPA